MNLPDKDAGDSVVVEFDFYDELDAVDTAAVVIVCERGTDPAVAAMLDGAPQVQGAKVLQRLRYGVVDARYELRATATRGSDIRVLAGIITIRRAR